MKWHNRWVVAGATAALGALAACNADKNLTATDTDQPDVKRALSTPDGIDAVLRGSFSAIFDGTHGNPPVGDLTPAAMGISLESYGSVNNYSMNIRATFPRGAIDNTRGNNTSNDNFRDFQTLEARGRTTSNAVAALDALTKNGGSLGSPSADARGRSFGFFVIGTANAELALMYDSAATPMPSLASSDIPPLQGYNEVMATALNQLDTAIAIATAAKTAGNSFTIPDTYMPITGGLSIDQYVRLVHSMKARFRAGVARTPAERAAVNWGAVLADAQAGITSDIVFNLNANAGWDYWWINQAAVGQGWSSETNHFIGMADTTGGYLNWLQTDRAARVPFLIVTPDKRFPAGETRAAQVANSPSSSAQLPSIYIRNRNPNDDNVGEAFANSFYDHTRFRQYRSASSIGPWIWMTRAESDLLAAEALMRLGRDAEAVPLVNRTRVINGLEAFPASANKNTPAPAQAGGSATDCVPRVPTLTGTNYTLSCGTLWEAMKYEKRLETQFTGYNQWYTDERGWGDLPAGSNTMWPVPYQEMDARREPFYNSLSTDPWVATTNTYGFGIGSK